MNWRFAFVLVLAALCVSVTNAQNQREGQASAEIRISLPAGVPPVVSFSNVADRVILELPQGSVYPEDFASSSGGLLSGGQVELLENGRVRLEIELGRGHLDEMINEPGSVVLRFKSRFGSLDESLDPSQQYLLGPDDKIKLTVHGQPELSSELTLTRGGVISVPVLGDRQAAGLSPRQLAGKLADDFGRCCLVAPQVDVEVVEFRSKWVMVSGEVWKPGRIPLRGGTTLKEVLGEAGGFTADSGETIRLTRQAGTNGDATVAQIDRKSFEVGEVNPLLSAGDIVEVTKAEWCYVQGEVQNSGRVKIERGMTLLKAISLAGGLTDWASRKDVRIIYPKGTSPGVQMVNLNKVENRKLDDPSLRGGEVIIVKRRYL